MNQRITATADAAARLFLQQGYARTQINHIAKAVGVSVGTVYLDFAGKQEILHTVLKSALDPDFLKREFQRPITNDLFVGLEQEIIQVFEQTALDFAKHLHTDDYSLEVMVSDAFDLLSRYALGCLFIEKNQTDFPLLADSYRRYRKQFFQTMTQYMRRFINQGTVRPLEHVELSTTLIIETLAWWAMDRRYLAFEPQDLSLALAKQVCMDNIVTAYRQ